MTDYLPRHIEGRLRAFAANFKAVLVCGARQTGKTTLLSHVFPNVKSVTFDPIHDIYGARRDPELFLDSFPPPLVLDEIQFAPELLPALKRRMDLSGDMGQYLLSGSQQLALLRNVSESLAGRVGIMKLGPMTPHELCGKGAEKPWIERYIESPDNAAGGAVERLPGTETLVKRLWRGSMPGVIDMPDALIPDYHRSYVETYVERDVRLQGEIRDLMQFGRFTGIAGASTAMEINASHIGREIGVTPKTARHWLDMLAACYQWVELPAYSGNAVKRVAGKRKGHIVDSGLACWLQRISSPDALAASPMLGRIFETFAATYLMFQAANMSQAPQAWHWRSRGGAEVDLLFERDGRLFPIEIKCKGSLTSRDARGIHSFIETYPSAAMPGVIVYAGKETYRVTKHATAVPWDAV